MKRLLLGVSVAAVLALGPLAWAQAVVTPTSQTQATTPTTDPAALAIADTVKVPVFPQVETLLPSDTPLPVKFGLGTQVIEGVDPALTSGVTFEGYARKVEVPVQDGTSKIGQILVMAVSKDERVETIDAQGLQAQFEANDDSLFPDKAVEVEGNRAALIAALQRLAGEPVAEEEPTKVEADNGTSGADGADGVGSNAAQNDPLANYQAPAVEATAEKEPVVSMDVTAEGCQVRVDEAQGVAIQQNRSVTMEDGVVTDKGQCSDGDKRFPLQKSYAACPDTVSLSTLSATANFQSYYVDDGGTTHNVGDCQPDPDAHFAISETTDGCTNSIDLNAGTVTVNTALVYSDRNGKQVQVRGCQPSSTKASISLTKTFGQCADKVNLAAKVVYPQYVQTYKDANGTSHTVSDCTPDIEQAKAITEDTKACTVRVDLATGQVVPQAALVYTNNAGQGVQVRGCQDAEASAPITLVKAYEACTDKVDLAALTATARFQWSYTANGSTQTVSECTTDTAAVSTITEDTKACTVRVDLATGKAIPQAALVYTDRSGKTVQVRGCEDATGTASIALQRNYEACTDKVDLTAMTAIARYQETYAVGDGSRQTVSECTLDAEAVSLIKEDTKACTVRVDLTTGKAIPQAALIYTDRTGKAVQVRGCEDATATPAIALQRDYEACSNLVNMTGLTVTPQYQEVYKAADGSTVVVSSCTPDAEKAVAIEKSYDACADKVDTTAGTASRQYQLTYVAEDGTRQSLSECRTDDDSTVELVKNYDGCSDVVDVASLTATRQYQLSYTDSKGVDHAVSKCQPDSTAVFQISEDTASCPVKIDLVNNQVVPQAVLSYVDAKGKTVPVRGCAASVETAATPLTKSYEACTDVVDVAALTATRRYQLTYTDKDGSQQAVSECQPDSAAVFQITEDTASCPVKIDLANNQVVPQAVLSYVDAKGKSVQVRGCAASVETAATPLTKSYEACTDVVDVAALTATRRYQLTYTDKDGSQQTVSECQPDSAAVFQITEDTASCPVKIDLANNQVVPQAVLSYVDAKGKSVQVRGCAASVETAATPLTKSYEACTDVVDVAALTATRRYQLTYTDRDGSQQTVSECQPDSAAVFPITEDPASCPVKIDLVSGKAIPQAVLSYEDAAGKTIQVRGCAPATASAAITLEKSYGACADVLDLDALTATPRYQMTYTADGNTQVVSDCAADTSAVIPITEDTKACDMAVDLDALTATPQGVLVYTDRNGKQVQVRGCGPVSSGQQVTLKQSYDACTILVDLGAAQAVPRYTLTYKDAKGLPHTVADCTPDGTKAVPIVEKVADCPVDVDLVAKVATVQSVLSYTTAEGEEVQVRGCAASSQEDPMPLTKTYGACADKVDLAALTAWAQYQWSYLDGKGALHTVTDCAPDETDPFAITENTSACPVSVEVVNQRAIIQSVQVYKDRTGKTVQAQDCQPSQTVAPLPMVQDVSSCPLRHDFPGSDVSGLGITTGQSVEQGMWVYTLAGQAYQATPCLETGRTFAHTTVTTANGAYICTPIIIGATVIIQGRTQITVDGLKQYITECAPVDSAEQTLQSTTDGCTDISAWSHDIASGVSYGQERFFYNKPNGQREYVTDCQTSSTAYLHNHQQSGWDYHDEGLYAYPLETVSIRISGIDQVIAIGQLLPGTPQMPYVKYGVMNQGTGDYSYEGCTKYEQTEQVTAWTRPDGTTYSQPIGPGPMTDLGDVCIYFAPSSTDAWEYKRLVSAGYENWRCQYEGTRTVIREDGETVSQTTATQGMSAPTVCSGAGGSQTCNYQCPAHPPLSEVSQWLTELGW